MIAIIRLYNEEIIVGSIKNLSNGELKFKKVYYPVNVSLRQEEKTKDGSRKVVVNIDMRTIHTFLFDANTFVKDTLVSEASIVSITPLPKTSNLYKSYKELVLNKTGVDIDEYKENVSE